MLLLQCFLLPGDLAVRLGLPSPPAWWSGKVATGRVCYVSKTVAEVIMLTVVTFLPKEKWTRKSLIAFSR